jgi:hypothetical protein
MTPRDIDPALGPALIFTAADGWHLDGGPIVDAYTQADDRRRQAREAELAAGRAAKARHRARNRTNGATA